MTYTYWGLEPGGRRVPLGEPIEAVFAFDADAPADQVKAVFPARGLLPALSGMKVEADGRPLFWGVVDEQNTRLSAGGLQVELVCRSREALLLDNEACPQPITDPSLPRLLGRLLEPLGFTHITGSKEPVRGTLEIEKGESCWQVLAGFCQGNLGVTPYVDPEGVLRCDGLPTGELALKEVSGAVLSQKPCKELSQVWQQSFRGGYDTLYRDKDAVAQRRRYCSSQSGLNPRAMIEQARRESWSVTVEAPAALWPLRGRLVTVDLPRLGTLSRCPVRSGRVYQDKKGLRTRLVLERGEEDAAG